MIQKPLYGAHNLCNRSASPEKRIRMPGENVPEIVGDKDVQGYGGNDVQGWRGKATRGFHCYSPQSKSINRSIGLLLRGGKNTLIVKRLYPQSS